MTQGEIRRSDHPGLEPLTIGHGELLDHGRVGALRSIVPSSSSRTTASIQMAPSGSSASSPAAQRLRVPSRVPMYRSNHCLTAGRTLTSSASSEVLVNELEPACQRPPSKAGIHLIGSAGHHRHERGRVGLHVVLDGGVVGGVPCEDEHRADLLAEEFRLSCAQCTQGGECTERHDRDRPVIGGSKKLHLSATVCVQAHRRGWHADDVGDVPDGRCVAVLTTQVVVEPIRLDSGSNQPTAKPTARS